MMDEKEKIGPLIELYRMQMDHFEKTRNIEFKVNIALWTLIVLVGQFSYGKIILSECCSLIVYIGISCIIIVAHLYWMELIQASQDRDLGFRRIYRSIIHNVLKSTKDGNQNNKDLLQELSELSLDKLKSTECAYRWIFCEVGITFILLLGLGIFLSLPQQQCSIKEFSKVYCVYQNTDK